jgi:hypothetical protein
MVLRWRHGEMLTLIIFYPGKPQCITLLFYTLFNAYALSLKELNETHLHIYPYPMGLTSMIGSCSVLCYRIPVEVE